MSPVTIRTTCRPEGESERIDAASHPIDDHIVNERSRFSRISGLRVPCRVADPDLWFADSPGELERAKALCTECPIRRACLSTGLDRAEPWGVWGGEIFDQGVVVARKRPRGRPRKQPQVA